MNSHLYLGHCWRNPDLNEKSNSCYSNQNSLVVDYCSSNIPQENWLRKENTYVAVEIVEFDAVVVGSPSTAVALIEVVGFHFHYPVNSNCCNDTDGLLNLGYYCFGSNNDCCLSRPSSDVIDY